MHAYVQLFYCQNYAQKLVDADRASLFLVDNKSNELYARIFDVGNNDNDDKVDKMIKEIRLVKSIDILFYYKIRGRDDERTEQKDQVTERVKESQKNE